MTHSRGSRVARRLALSAAVGATCFTLASLYVGSRYRHLILPAEQLEPAEIALVFGAGLASAAEPSAILAERMDAAIALYRAGRVRRLLLSGDNSERYHNETGAMRRYAIEHGVPAAAITSDSGGVSTFDSCLNARKSFGVRRAILVTQAFHLPRALYIANSLGLSATGLAADANRKEKARYPLREFISRPVALWMVLVERFR